MAVCPQCGSPHITLKRDTDINWGRALVGWAAFGVVGGAVAGVTGEDRNAVTCLDCGATWRAADIYKVIQIVKEATGASLDLTLDEHRRYLAAFMEKVSPYFEEISRIEPKAIKLVADAKTNTIGPASLTLTSLGCLGWMAIFTLMYTLNYFSFGNLLWWSIIILSFLLPVLLARQGGKIDEAKGWTHEKAIAEAEAQAAKLRADARASVLTKIRGFTRANPLQAPLPESRSVRRIPPPPPPPPLPPSRSP